VALPVRPPEDPAGRRLEPLAHAAGQLVDEGEEALLRVALHPLGGEDLAALRVLEGGLDADLGARLDEAAHEGRRGLGLARDGLHDLGRHRPVVAVAGVLEELVEAARAEDAQARRLREVRDQHVGEAGAQPVEPGIAGQVVEVEDRHRAPAVLGRGRRLAPEEEGGHRRQDDESPSHRDGQGPAPAPGRGRDHEPRAAGRRPEDELPAVHVTLQVLEVAPEVARRLVAVLGSLLERALDHPRERLRDVVAQLAGRARRVLQDRGQDGQVGVAAERPLPGGHLVEDDAEGEDVGAVVDGQALGLLRRHVGDRPHDAPVLGDRLRLLRRAVAVVGSLPQLGEAEVEDLEPPVRGEHHVVGLQVPVQDALPVGSGHGVGEGDREREEPLHREAVGRDRLAESLSLDELHGQEAEAVLLLEGTVEGHDARVAERGDRLRLALEALDLLGVGCHLRGEDLEGHPPVEPRVLGEVHVPHAPRAERLQDAVGAQCPADQAAVGLRLCHDEDYDARGREMDPRRDICSQGPAATSIGLNET
jgi:hypothetical protein